MRAAGPAGGSRERLRPVASGPISARQLGWLVGLAALVLYAATCARGVEWQDAGIHQYRILSGQLGHPLGLALTHPLHWWLGRGLCAFPAGDPLFKLNLLSSLGGAVAVGVLATVVRRLTRSTPAAVFAAVTVALSHSFWQMSALTETYTLAAALMAIEWLLLLRYAQTQRPGWLLAVFAINGLHVADHLLGLLTLATYGVLLLIQMARRRVAPGWLLLAGVVWAVAASPYLGLVGQQLAETGDVAGTLRSALFGGGGALPGFSDDVLNTTLSWRQVKLAGMSYAYCFPSLAALLALWGILRPAHGPRALFRWVLLAQTIIICLFVGRYTIADLYTYFVPVCVLTGLWVGVGVAGLLRRLRTVRARRWAVGLLAVNAALPVAVYLVFPTLAAQRGWLRDSMRDIPLRDEYSSFLRPWRFHDDAPQRFARTALGNIRVGGWIVADSTVAPTVAAERLAHPIGPEAVRVYWWRFGLVPVGQPMLGDDELRAFVRDGGEVLTIPSAEIDSLLGDDLVLVPTEPFWRVTGDK